MATVSISGVLADEKRRVAVLRFDEARKPPTGESRASGGPRIPAATRATIGPRQPTATTRNSAVISDVGAATSRAPVGARPRPGRRVWAKPRTGAPPRRAPGGPPSWRPAPTTRVSPRHGPARGS